MSDDEGAFVWGGGEGTGDGDDDFSNPALGGDVGDGDEDGSFVWGGGGGGDTSSDEEHSDSGSDRGGAAEPQSSLDLLGSLLAGADMTDAIRQPEPEPELKAAPKKKNKRAGEKKDPVAMMKALKAEQNAKDQGSPRSGTGSVSEAGETGESAYVGAHHQEIGQFLQRKVNAAAAAAAAAQERERTDAHDELEDQNEDDRLIPEIPPRMSISPAAVARPPRQPKVVTISTGTEDVRLEIQGTERVGELDSNLKELLAQKATLPAASGFHLTDAEGDSVVLSASIPDGTALSLTTLHFQRPPPPLPPSDPSAAPADGGDGTVGGDSKADADGDSGDAADADEGKKKCCVVM